MRKSKMTLFWLSLRVTLSCFLEFVQLEILTTRMRIIGILKQDSARQTTMFPWKHRGSRTQTGGREYAPLYSLRLVWNYRRFFSPGQNVAHHTTLSTAALYAKGRQHMHGEAAAMQDRPILRDTKLRCKKRWNKEQIQYHLEVTLKKKKRYNDQ